MNDLVLASKAADWYKLKTLVLDSVSSPITRRVYNMALNEFLDWFRLAPRPGFSKATVSAWRASLEARGLGCSCSSLCDHVRSDGMEVGIGRHGSFSRNPDKIGAGAA
jgi:hypothetical protein